MSVADDILNYILDIANTYAFYFDWYFYKDWFTELYFMFAIYNGIITWKQSENKLPTEFSP